MLLVVLEVEVEVINQEALAEQEHLDKDLLAVMVLLVVLVVPLVVVVVAEETLAVMQFQELLEMVALVF